MTDGYSSDLENEICNFCKGKGFIIREPGPIVFKIFSNSSKKINNPEDAGGVEHSVHMPNITDVVKQYVCYQCGGSGKPLGKK